MAGTYKSIFKPKHPKKYIGDASNIICRSNWEREFCNYCDSNKNIVTWASEEFCIPYISPLDNKKHRYYPDFLIQVKEADGKLKKYVIEIKPKKQTIEPKKRSSVTKSYIYEVRTYAINQAKWQYAREFCKDNSLEFKIITEDQLYGRGTGKVSRRSNK